MIHTVVYAVLWLLSLFIAVKLGQASEIVRALREGEPRRAPVDGQSHDPGFGSSGSVGAIEPSPSQSVFDQEARHLEVVDS